MVRRPTEARLVGEEGKKSVLFLFTTQRFESLNVGSIGLVSGVTFSHAWDGALYLKSILMLLRIEKGMVSKGEE